MAVRWFACVREATRPAQDTRAARAQRRRRDRSGRPGAGRGRVSRTRCLACGRWYLDCRGAEAPRYGTPSRTRARRGAEALRYDTVRRPELYLRRSTRHFRRNGKRIARGAALDLRSHDVRYSPFIAVDGRVDDRVAPRAAWRLASAGTRDLSARAGGHGLAAGRHPNRRGRPRLRRAPLSRALSVRRPLR